MSGLTASDRRLGRDLAHACRKNRRWRACWGGVRAEEEHATFMIAMAPRKELHCVSHFPMHERWCSEASANQTGSAVVCQWISFVRRIRPRSKAICSKVLTGTHDKSATTRWLLVDFHDKSYWFGLEGSASSPVSGPR